MSGSTGASDVVGGSTSEAAQASDLVAVQTSGTHVGTPSGAFGFFWNGAVLSFQAGIAFIATADLYAALNASPTASALLSWSD